MTVLELGRVDEHNEQVDGFEVVDFVELDQFPKVIFEDVWGCLVGEVDEERNEKKKVVGIERMPAEEVVDNLYCVIRVVEVPDVLEEVDQLAVQLDGGGFRLVPEQPLPYLSPVELVILKGSLGQLENTHLYLLVVPQKVKVCHVSFHKI